jgi:hypothetical protein
MKIKYKRISVEVEGEKPKVCRCCEKEVKQRGLHLHHTSYDYSTDEVRNNHSLALRNTVWLCYHCHRIANAMRICDENYEKTLKLIELIPGIEMNKILHGDV